MAIVVARDMLLFILFKSVVSLVRLGVTLKTRQECHRAPLTLTLAEMVEKSIWISFPKNEWEERLLDSPGKSAFLLDLSLRHVGKRGLGGFRLIRIVKICRNSETILDSLVSELTTSSIISSVGSTKSSDLDIRLFLERFPESAEGQILVARQNESFFQEAFGDLVEDFETIGLPRSVRNATFSFLQGNAPRVGSRAQKKKIQAWLSDKNRTALVELFSSPRVAVEAKSRGLYHSGSFDIAHGWDLTKDSSQEEVWSVLDKDKPYLVILSPMCRAFSQMMESNLSRMDLKYPQEAEQDCLSQLRFCLQVAEYQVKHGRKFLFEHPLGASSWACDGVKLVESLEGVFCTEADLWQFGLSVVSGELSKKPTRFMSNDPYVLGELHRR